MFKAQSIVVLVRVSVQKSNFLKLQLHFHLSTKQFRIPRGNPKSKKNLTQHGFSLEIHGSVFQHDFWIGINWKDKGGHFENITELFKKSFKRRGQVNASREQKLQVGILDAQKHPHFDVPEKKRDFIEFCQFVLNHQTVAFFVKNDQIN